MARLVDKQKKIKQYDEDLSKAKVAVVAEYRGLTVAQLSGLRVELFKHNAKFSIVKNTLLKRAIKGTDGAALDDYLKGPMGVLFGFGDEVAPTKVLKDFLSKAKLGEIKGGVLGAQQLSAKEVIELAELPPLEELRGKLLGAINAPQAGLVSAISGPARGLVNVLDQYAKQKEGSAA